MQSSNFINGFFLKDILREKPNNLSVLLQILLLLSVVVITTLAYILPYNYVHVMITGHYDEISEKKNIG